MAKFCPNCGNQMSENVKFCMECGTKLGDYTSSGAEIKDSMIHRSQIGAASVGNIHISPVIKIESEKQDSLEKQIAFEKRETKSKNKVYIIGFMIFIILLLLWYLLK